MDLLHRLLTAEPLLALFITIALGYFVGKLKAGNFVLGGIAGTLLVGVVIGQFGVDINSGIKSIFFALFIYAVGFQGGPQFFHALNRRSLNQLVSAFVMCFTGLLCVLAAAWMFGLDRGMAAGLAAGGLTQSAIIGDQEHGRRECRGLAHGPRRSHQARAATAFLIVDGAPGLDNAIAAVWDSVPVQLHSS
jgi:AspT/YidE/YbjL antiporter-like protein